MGVLKRTGGQPGRPAAAEMGRGSRAAGGIGRLGTRPGKGSRLADGELLLAVGYVDIPPDEAPGRRRDTDEGPDEGGGLQRLRGERERVCSGSKAGGGVEVRVQREEEGDGGIVVSERVCECVERNFASACACVCTRVSLSVFLSKVCEMMRETVEPGG